MTKNTQKGFTLIELLVVIAIIGILATIVLTSLSSARLKATDAKTQGQLSSMRATAESFYSTNSNYIGTATSPVTNCTTAGSMFADTTSGFANLLSTSNYPTGTSFDCAATATAWAVAASTSAGAFCADSTGAARGKNSAGNAYTGVNSGTYPAKAASATVCN